MFKSPVARSQQDGGAPKKCRLVRIISQTAKKKTIFVVPVRAIQISICETFRRPFPNRFRVTGGQAECGVGLRPVMYNERLREEKAGPGEERKHTKRVGPKKDLMDAALDGRNRAALDVDDAPGGSVTVSETTIPP